MLSGKVCVVLFIVFYDFLFLSVLLDFEISSKNISALSSITILIMMSWLSFTPSKIMHILNVSTFVSVGLL